MSSPAREAASNLLSLHQHRFAPLRRKLGQLLAQPGNAALATRTPSEVCGTVTDRATRTCFLCFDASGALTTSCSCQGPDYCEHAFALLVLEDEQRARDAEVLRTTTAAAAKAPAPPKPKPKPKPAPPPDWQHRLEAIRPRTVPRRREPVPITFRIEVAASRKRRQLAFQILCPRDGIPGKALQRIPYSLERGQLHPTAQRVMRQLRQVSDSYGYRELPDSQLGVLDPMASTILPLLFTAGTVTATQGPLLQPPAASIRLDEGPPFTLHVERRHENGAILLRGQLQRGDERIDASQVLVQLDEWAILHDRAVRVTIAEAARPLAQNLLHEGELAVPDAHFAALQSRLAEIGAAAPGLWQEEPVEDAGAPVVHLLVDTQRLIDRDLLTEVRFLYDDLLVEVEGAELLPPAAPGRPLRRRSRRLEAEAMGELRDAVGADFAPTHLAGHYILHARTAGATLARLAGLGARIYVNGKFVRPGSGTSLSIRTTVDWFEVRGELQFAGGGAVALNRSLAAPLGGLHTVELGDGTLGLLSGEWLATWRHLTEFGEAKRDAIRLQRSQAMLLDALLAARDGVRAEFDDDYRQLSARLEQFAGITARQPPRTFQGQLRPYQEQGLGWLHFLRELHLGGCLADDMGLGKTVQVLALLDEVHGARSGPPSLLVVPRSLLDNWRREAARFTPGLRVLEFHGTTRWDRLAAAGGLSSFDVVVTTYGTLRLDVQRFEADATSFQYAILDEAQAIENENSLTSKAVRLLRAHHRLALTGTPVQNHIGELWALFEFLNPGLLGKSRAFQGLLKQQALGGGLDLRVLHRALAPFLLRRTKGDVLPDLPQKQEQDLLCTMEGSQRAVYGALRDHYQQILLQGEAKLGAKERFVALEALLRLRQAACHEGLIEPLRRANEAAKLEVLLPMLKELADSGHKALVFSQFTGFLAIVRERLDALGLRHEYLDGATTKRQEAVDRFQQDPTCPLFLISLKAGGFGLNLTAADYVFLLDPWWNPAAEAQAADRAHRIGQTQRVTVYRLITKDTVEEKVLQLQHQKKQLVDAVLGADQSLLAKLTREDLAALLS